MTEALTSARRSRANRGFGIVVAVSLGLHVLAIGSAIYAQSRKPAMKPIQSSVPVQLVKLGKKRDPKLLPRKVQEVPAAAPPEAVALETSKPDPNAKPVTRKPPNKLSDRAQRLLDGVSSDARLDRALDKIEEAEGDPDGDIHGTTTDATNAASGYTAAILGRLQSSYSLPETIPAAQRQFLNAQVLVFVESDGTILRYEFVERHPNETFMSALESMLKSVKLPPPPAALAGSVREAGVLVRFRPR